MSYNISKVRIRWLFLSSEVELGGHVVTFTCGYFSSQVIFKLSQRVREHFAMLTEISLYLITCNSGHICREENQETQPINDNNELRKMNPSCSRHCVNRVTGYKSLLKLEYYYVWF